MSTEIGQKENYTSPSTGAHIKRVCVENMFVKVKFFLKGLNQFHCATSPPSRKV